MGEEKTIGCRIDGQTSLFGIAGDPIAQTLSPQSVTPLLQAEGANAVLVPLHVPADRFEAVMRGLMGLHNFRGSMVTYPFKAQALALLDTLRPTAKLVGAVNAIRRERDGSWTGDIFDGRGLVAGLASEHVTVAGTSVLLLGAGGAGSAIALALAEAGAARLTIFDVDKAKLDTLVAVVAAAHPDCRVEAGDASTDGVDIVVNATPLGMSPGDPLPIAEDALNPRLAVMDIVPKPGTPLIEAARRRGCRTIDYLAMAHGQYATIARFFAEVC